MPRYVYILILLIEFIASFAAVITITWLVAMNYLPVFSIAFFMLSLIPLVGISVSVFMIYNMNVLYGDK